jgi:hypothetical protein
MEAEMMVAARAFGCRGRQGENRETCGKKKRGESVN